MEDNQLRFMEFVGPTAHAGADALRAVADNDLLHLLATWNPGPDWSAPSRKVYAASSQTPSSKIQPGSPLSPPGSPNSTPPGPLQ